MDRQDLWLGRELRDRGLVPRDALVWAAAAVNESERAGQPKRLLAALVEAGVIRPDEAAGLVKQLTPKAEAIAASAAALAASWADMTALPAAALEPAPLPAPEPAAAAPAAAAVPPPLPALDAAPPPIPGSGRYPAKPATPSGRRRAVSSGRLRAMAKESASQRALAIQAAQGRRRVVLVALGVVGAIALGAAAMRSGGPGPAPASSPAPVASSQPEPVATPPPPVAPPPPEPPHLKGEPEVARHESAGRYAEAVRRAREVADHPACDAAARERLLAALPRLERARDFQAELEGALREGAASPRLRALIVKVERGELEPELAELPLLEVWRGKVRTAIGSDEYALIAIGSSEDGGAVPESRAEHLAGLARQGAERLAAARRRLVESDAADVARVRSEAQRALAAAAAIASPLAVPAHRGRPAGEGRLVGYDARGFALRQKDGTTRRWTWEDAPAAAACDVLDLALDLRDPAARLRLARTAARGGLIPRAKEHLAALGRLEPERRIPSLELLERRALLIHNKGRLTQAGVDLRYEFAGDDADEAEDFTHYGPGWMRVWKGSLCLMVGAWPEEMPGAEEPAAKVPVKPSEHVRAYHCVAFDQGFEATITLEAGLGELLIGTPEGVAAIGSAGVGTSAGWEKVHETPRRQVGFDPGKPFKLRVTRPRPRSDAQRLVLTQGSATLAELDLPAAYWPTALKIGARVGPMLVADLRLFGHADPEWLEEAQDARDLSLELWADYLIDDRGGFAGLELANVEDLEKELERLAEKLHPLPPELEPNSAEDAASLEGIPQRAKDELALARKWARRRWSAQATTHAREAVALGRRRYWAAEYVLAWLESVDAWGRHHEGGGASRVRLDQAIAAVEGFAEALALRSRLLLRDGRLDEARRDAEAALAARPDLAPAHLALAWLLVREGKLDAAVESARLAAALSNDQATVVEELREIEAQRDGPSWSEPVTRESAGYVLVTDVPEKADEVLAALESARAAAPRLFPCLRERPGARVQKARVLLFSRRGDYMRYAYRATGSSHEDSAGFFDPESGILHAWEGRRAHRSMIRTIRHEATHQWCHGLGLELPYWANEAIADYVGGWDEEAGRSRAEPRRVGTLLRPGAKVVAMADLMTMTPGQFYAGETFLHYAQAWSFVHCCMESGDAKLKSTLFEYLELHTRGQAGDRSGQSGVTLDHIYARTFHQLERKKLDEAWWAHVQRLAEEAQRSPEDW